MMIILSQISCPENFRLQDFKSIQDKQGYYLSHLKLPTKIYRKEFETVVFKTKPA